MKALTKTNSEVFYFYLPFLIIVFIGSYLRLDQFAVQVLLDDEWHAVHQLIKGQPEKLFQTFSHADFSVPLALLYWIQLKLFGLSETGMRWPMMLAGISTLVVFPLYIRKFFDDKTTLVFSLLLAISPLLIIYSRTARPYSLTLLLSIMALAAFNHYVAAEKSPWKPGLSYFACAILSVWLHLITLPLVVAPFLTVGIPALLARNWTRLRRILWLALITAMVLFTLVLPPLLSHPEILGSKLGIHTPELATFYGAFFTWLGTPSLNVFLLGMALAVLGASRLWRGFPLIFGLLTGLGLTLGVILLTQPQWVNHSLTLARYLLPMVPLLLLSISLGVSQFSDVLVSHWGGRGTLLVWALLGAALILTVYASPLHKILARPNSNSLHLVYQFDFRKEHNLVDQYQQSFPLSPFWQLLASSPRGSLKIAASPFYFETYHWDAPRWEQISGQRVMPGYLTGLCVEHRWGEVPDGDGFRFQNVGYVGDPSDLAKRGFDLVVFQKPVKTMTTQGEVELGKGTRACDKAHRKLYPEPVYEDEWLVAFPLSEKVRSQVDAER